MTLTEINNQLLALIDHTPTVTQSVPPSRPGKTQRMTATEYVKRFGFPFIVTYATHRTRDDN